LIFVTVGNWHKGFDRLVKAIDELKMNKIINEDVIGQIGPGAYKPKYFQYRDYYSQEEFMEYLTKSRLIISHAGMGTIGQAVRLSKPVIVVPRKSSQGEHVDDHQFNTTKYMELEGKVLAVYAIEDLPEKIKLAETFIPTKGHDSEDINKLVQEFIDSVLAKMFK
jgi:UDP-N-acetylglucosamine transferase subunit ALG13